MIPTRKAAYLAATVLIVAAACSAPGAPTAAPTTAPTGKVCDNLPAGSAGDLLETICNAGTITMSTDPAYPPQSELAPDDPLGYKGFDIDVGKEIADRLGVDIAFETPAWEVLTAGSWNGRWDFSVGSMTVTSARQAVLDFTEPYYYTPAQLAVLTSTGITTTDGLAGKVICVGEGTTYLDWINGTLDFGTESPQTTPPAGSTATTLPTDRDCANAWGNGRHDFDGWLSSITTVQAAIDDGLPVTKVGDPVFYEPLAVALDKSGPDHDALLATINQIVADMHADGTLTQMSMKWFDYDYTVKAGS
jgi:polar amino acid transport system substrate-binding protein